MKAEEKYFCAANSGMGFVSFYGQLIDNAERVFIIKGGPGVGKGWFLRRVAKSAELNGERVVYYYCSSDQDSLDAIVIDGRTVLLDGTAPHEVGTKFPGVRDEIIDLGAFWDSAKLYGNSRTVKKLNLLKSESFGRAYEYLSSAAAATRVTDGLIQNAVLYKKLAGATERALRKLPNGNGYRERTVILSSYGMRGEVHFDSLKQTASEYVTVSNDFGCAHRFFDELIKNAEKKGLSVTVAKDPLMPERISAVRFDVDRRVYEIGSRSEKHINMRRFLDASVLKSNKEKIRRAERLRRSATAAALESMKEASAYHFELERIYGEAMDFAAKEEFTENFLAEMYG